MITKQIQVKFNLPIELKKVVDEEAKKYGMTLAGFFRHILVDRIEKKERYKTFEPSNRTIRLIKKAKKEQQEGKFIRVDDVSKFFENL